MVQGDFYALIIKGGECMATFYNQATLSYNGNVTNSNIVQGEFREVLSATKTAIMNDYTAKDDLTYVISIVNAGSTGVTGLTVTDNLGAYEWNGGELVPLTYVEGSLQYYLNGELQPVPTVTAGNELVVTELSVPANGNAMIIYEAVANQFAPLGQGAGITNRAAISVAGAATFADITVDAAVVTEDRADLTISKSVFPDVVIDDNELTYTFVIQNSGNTGATAEDEVTVTDIFDPILSDITVTLNGTSWVEGTNYTYNDQTGEFETIPGQITVPAATYTQDAAAGVWITNPGVSVLTVTGTI